LVMSINRTFLVASFAVAAAGCFGPAEEIGQSIMALGETECRTAPRDDINTPALCVCCTGGVSTSPTASYGSATCPNQYLVGYGGFSGQAAASVHWADDLPNTQAAC